MTEVRRLEESDLSEVRRLYEATFSEDSKAYVDYYFAEHLDLGNVIGSFDESRLISMLHLNPYQIMWQGQLYRCSYFVAVATDEKYRRQGLMREAITWALNDLYKKGEVFSLLMPIDSKYYEQFGFGFIEDIENYQFKYLRQDFSFKDVVSKELSDEDGSSLMGIYNAYKTNFDLSNNRGMKDFGKLIREVQADHGQVILVPEGYVGFYKENDKKLIVRETAYASKEGFENIFSYIGKIAGDMTIEWQAPLTSPLRYLVPHRNSHTIVRKPYMMARIINVESFLSDMARFIGDCIIKVTDAQIFENNGIYKCNGQEAVRVEMEQSVQPDLVIDVMSLSQWLFGYASLESLVFTRNNIELNRDFTGYPEYPIDNYFIELV